MYTTPNSSYRITSLMLALFSIIQVTESAFTPPSGVRYNTLESYLISNGMKKCYDKPYSSATYESSFDACQGASWVFVGAKASSSDTQLFMGAFGLASDVFRYSYDTTKGHEANGVYWYKVQYYSFGFAGVESIFLRYADIASTQPSTRLSWHYNSNGYGGWRAGSNDFLNNNGNFRKVIYMLPSGNGQPTAMPTAALPSCNVEYASYLGDGLCDQGPYNTAACDYDRGDCCSATCVNGLYMCGIAGYSCIDPQGSTSTSTTPTMSPISSPSISPTNAPISIQITKTPTAGPTARPIGSESPSSPPTLAPTAPTAHPTNHPSREPSTSTPTAVPSETPTAAPSIFVLSEFVQTFEVDSARPYLTGMDIYKAVQYENMTSYDLEGLYYTTITFSENTQLREGSDYIAIFKDSRHREVYGKQLYTGTDFPGMNGAAALGFRDFRFVFHFHSAPSGVIVDDYGYQMTVTITRYSKSSDVPPDSLGSSSGETAGTYLGLSYAGFTAVFTVLITVASLCFCCLLFWYRRAQSAAKVAAEEQLFDNRILDHREALKQSRIRAKKGKVSSKYSKSNSTVEETSNGHSDALRANAPAQYLCPISSELMSDPVICKDGHTYDRQSIEMWLVTHGTSPMTNVPMSNEVMIPNLAVKETIQNYIFASNSNV